MIMLIACKAGHLALWGCPADGSVTLLREAMINFSRNPKSLESEMPACFLQNVDSSLLLMQQNGDIVASEPMASLRGPHGLL